jgi:ABC-type oligopeptide transport system substrate-binding subunit
MLIRKKILFTCGVLLALSVLLTACSGGGNSTATPGTGEEHSLPSAQAGYPAGGGLPTVEPGYPQP